MRVCHDATQHRKLGPSKTKVTGWHHENNQLCLKENGSRPKHDAEDGANLVRRGAQAAHTQMGKSTPQKEKPQRVPKTWCGSRCGHGAGRCGNHKQGTGHRQEKTTQTSIKHGAEDDAGGCGEVRRPQTEVYTICNNII